MSHTIHIYDRLTYRYHDAWRHLDGEQYIGEAKQLGLTRRIQPAGYDDGGEYHFRVIAPSALKGRDLSRPISQTLSGSSCTHEYDCCGCASTRASVRRIDRRTYSVKLAVSFNY